jgi:hypothetical protein
MQNRAHPRLGCIVFFLYPGRAGGLYLAPLRGTRYNPPPPVQKRRGCTSRLSFRTTSGRYNLSLPEKHREFSFLKDQQERCSTSILHCHFDERSSGRNLLVYRATGFLAIARISSGMATPCPLSIETTKLRYEFIILTTSVAANDRRENIPAGEGFSGWSFFLGGGTPTVFKSP